MDKLEELVYLTIGRAQMAWKEMPTGTPDDEKACGLGKQLITAIREHEQEAIQREKSIWLLSHPLRIRDNQGNVIAQSKGFYVPIEGSENAV